MPPACLLLAALLASGGACTAGRARAPVASESHAPSPGADSARISAARLAALERLASDWPNLGKYAAANRALGDPLPGEDRVVFIGNSIIESWGPHFATLFPGRPYINRGISGQTTPQILLRLRQDVIALRPKVVLILAGTNDIAGNTGPATLEMIQHNLASMAELARANGIRVVLASVLPAREYRWRPDVRPATAIVALNDWMRAYARRNGIVYLDFHAAMADEQLGLRRELSGDGVHPNETGYRIMAPLATRAIDEALRLPLTGPGSNKPIP
ncbi:MAG TPA: SGNH/GDSL hydrolase family protein [Gemmatimonadaceae bacterium]